MAPRYVCSRMQAHRLGRPPLITDAIDAMRKAAGLPAPKPERIRMELVEVKPYDFPESLILYLDHKF